MSFEFKEVNVVALTATSLLIKWDIDTDIPLNNLNFSIQRSEIEAFNENDDLETVATGIPGTSVLEFQDSPELRNLFRKWWYRVIAKDITTQDLFYSGITTWYEVPDPITLTIREEIARTVEYDEGEPYYLFTQRTVSDWCPDCTDPVTHLTTRSRCPTCLGTGKNFPYFYPRRVFFSMSPPMHIVRFIDFETHRGSKQCYLAGYPLIAKSDVVVQSMDNSIYIVDNVKTFGRRDIIAHQVLNLIELMRDHVFREVFLTETQKLLDKEEAKRRASEREF